MEDPLRQTFSGLTAPEGTEIIETLGWHPDTGVRFADLHLARMGRTAAVLGFRFDADIAQSLLHGLASLQPLRCRLALAAGAMTLTTAPVPPTPPRWRVGIAAERLVSNDPWLAHKTTQRTLYDNARANLPAGQDEWLFLNERAEVCEGAISNVFVTLADGTRVTPPLTCGLLPGILRQTLLGQYVEQIVTLDDLRQATAIHMGNALRGLIPCDFIGIA
jgi:4-amino-4-deoxychorismate lyase